MTGFLEAAAGYPTAICSALLGVVLVYWLLAIVGLVDIESGLDIDGDAADLGAVASFLVSAGLSGVPVSLIASLLVVFSWTASCLAGMWLLPLLPAGGLQWLAGTGVLLGSFVLAYPATLLAIRPLRGLFTIHAAARPEALVGRSCTVRTLTVDERLGQAEVETGAATAIINVRAQTPNRLAKGANARILGYDARAGHYRIELDLGRQDS
ncbi:ubiquinone biosynthesis protein [Aquabacterium sp. A7-Y]|uniref:ubiquinone biosynthesis protein n=1 Tax=Aquabacterium sp. A7-Y TaxID=1349605 RepID=UPI00223CBB6C|nr:ubiquinone biosynthesis protein [Aquabacterium sp. A7-Y]MCW7536568.1 ubiquinone biosynthesis protein [Aquabacterium sp. A7-Y]